MLKPFSGHTMLLSAVAFSCGRHAAVRQCSDGYVYVRYIQCTSKRRPPYFFRAQAGLGLVLGSFLGIGSFLRVRRLSIILKQQEERERESREQREPPLAGRGRGRLLVAVRAVVSPPPSLSLSLSVLSFYL